MPLGALLMARRKSLRVILSDADLDLVADKLRGVLPMAVEVVETPTSIESLLSALGSTRRESITRAAIAIAGTSDKRSTAYRSARRRIERYTTGGTERRKARPSALESIARVIRKPHLPTDLGLSIAMVADVIYNGQGRTMPSGGSQFIAPRALGTVRARLRSGDEHGAARELLNAFVFAYGLHTEADATGVIGNIVTIDIIGGKE